MPPRSSIPSRIALAIASGILEWSFQHGFIVLRTSHLRPLARLIRRRQKKHESLKAALYHNGKIAVLSIFLNIMPLIALGALLVLNLQTRNLGTVSTHITTRIQFVATSLEVLI